MRTLAVMALAMLAAPQDKIYSNSYLGKAPPELVSEKDHGFNAKDALKLEKLKGRVVWLEFSFLN